MPRNSRSKSHKQSKHSSKDVREHSESEEDVKMKERNGKEEGSSRVSKDLESGEKRKVSSQSRDGKDPPGHGNGDASEEHVASKRRKEKADGGSDRWNSGGNDRGDGVTIDNKDIKGESSRIDVDKSSKSKESSKGLGDSKSKSSRRHDSGSEKKDVNVSSVVEKEESKGGSRVDSKRKSEKDSGRRETHHQVKDVKESKEKEKKAQDGEITRKQGSKSVDLSEDRQQKRGRENTDWPIQDELRNPELEKELEKRIRRRGDGSIDKDKYQDDLKESDDRRLSSKADHAKDGKYKDAKHKDGSHGDKYREEGDKDNRQREDKYRDDDEKDKKHRDVKYREDGERENRHRDDRYRDDSDKDNRHRDEKHREDGIRENRRKADKYREDVDRDNRRRDDKYREDGDNDDRYKDDKYREDGNRDSRHRGEKYREDVDRDSRHRDGKQGDDIDREKRARDVKYRDRHSSRDRTSESDTKRLRDEGNAADIHCRKSSIRDGSPVYDDRVTRYKDDNGRRRASEKEEHNDIRSRSTKEQHSDAEKRSMSSAKVELVTERGRSISRNADAEITLNHSHRRSSPSSGSHAARDHYRNSKQEESKYRDYNYEERVRHHITSNREYTGTGLTDKNSSSRSLEKSIQRVDSHVGEASVERRLRSDARGSPLQLVDKSPSSTSNDRRHFNRSDARRSLDVEDSGQRSGGFKDARDYTGKEGKGSREMPMETHPGDELSQADADSSFVSSPFTRTSHFSASSRSLLPPPPPFRTGVESSLVFGSSEDDNRGKSNNNRHRRIGDPNMGRNQGNAWKGVPTWPSPLPNGFMPFQHGPPPVGFHPVMQQFPAPPIFGTRPSMDLNHTVPYHIPDNDRFSGHGRWRNPVDDSCPTPIHGWDANNVFGDESHLYGRVDWDHNRSQMSSRGWETSGDIWKGQNSRASADLPSAPLKDDSARGPADESFVGQSDHHSPNEQNQLELPAESINISQSSEVPKTTHEVLKTTPEESHDISKVSIKDDALLCHVYLSKLDISADLAQPELYEKCMSLIDMDQHTMTDEDYPKILYVEEVGEAKTKVPDKTSSASLFAAISDSVYQKAIYLYKKQREEISAINREQLSFLNAVNPEPVPTPDCEKVGVNDGKIGEAAPACDQEEAEGAISNYIPEKTDPPAICPKLEPVVENSVEKLEEPISTLNEVKMEVDLVEEEAAGTILEAKPLTEAHLTGCVEDVNGSCNSEGNIDESLENTKCGGGALKISDVSTEGCEAVMAESIESGSVNLSRIHHSPESTH